MVKPSCVEKRILALKGAQFESLCFDSLDELGFVNLIRQTSGTQFGYDIAADRLKNGKLQHWVFECKKFSSRLPVKEVSSKLVWADTQNRLYCFVIMSNAMLSNDLRHLIDSHSADYKILSWTGEVFFTLLDSCPKTFHKWFKECRRKQFLEPSQFLSQEFSRFWDEPTLIEQLTAADESFNFTFKVRRNSPGDQSFRIVFADERKRRIAEFWVRKNQKVQFSISNEFKGKKILIWYDFFPHAYVPGYQSTVETLKLVKESYLLPSSEFLRRFRAPQKLAEIHSTNKST